MSDLCLFRVAFRGKVYRCPFDPSVPRLLDVADLPAHLSEDIDFAGIHDLRIEHPLPRIREASGGILCALNQTENYFLDLRGSFEDYLRSFSSKTRSTLQRKVRKFAELSGGQLEVRVYRSVEQMREYHVLARSIASRTYQEKLFQGALPDTAEFCQEMQRLASEDQVRGFLLFLKEQPVAYLYVPVAEDVADYSYLGYDPDFSEHSPGTVLLYRAIEELFAERRYSYFNFGYGNNQTKTTFCTGHFLRADVYFFRKSMRNWLALYGQTWMDGFSEFCGRILDRIGLRRVVKRFLRSRL